MKDDGTRTQLDYLLFSWSIEDYLNGMRALSVQEQAQRSIAEMAQTTNCIAKYGAEMNAFRGWVAPPLGWSYWYEHAEELV